MNQTNDNVDRPTDAKPLQDQVKEKEQVQSKAFGTFSGVFAPTLLTILGVIMFLREGWVVGNAGLLGAWLIILIAFGITGFTGLSLSSITTNIRIGAGGAFSIISQSLGLEVGGSIGVPLYLSQALAVSMYIFGFRAGWLWIFPDHPALIVDLVTFGVLFVIAFISAGLAFKIQYAILAVIALALISVLGTMFQGPLQHSVQWWGEFKGSPETGFAGTGFWTVFAVFFPASTGIMAGANMSGDLKNPRRSIPVGTMSAIGLSLVIYLVLAYWLARTASPDKLVENYTIMIDKAVWGPAVLAGLLGATFSSALSSLVGAPRILQALGSHDILPAGKWFATKTPTGEPRNAMLLTGAIVLGALMLRDLNAVAPLITMFFLITYAMINIVVLIEQHLGLVSFRPLLRLPRFVALAGAAGCVFAMFIVNPLFSVLSVIIVVVLHALLIRKHLRAPFGDMRSGLFVAIAEWAAKKASQLTASRERSWKANLLLPVEASQQVQEAFEVVRNISYPSGYLKIVGLTGRENEHKLAEELSDVAKAFHDAGVFASWTIITAATFGENLQAGIETFAGAFFKPNVVFLTMPQEKSRESEVKAVLDTCRDRRIGVLLLQAYPRQAKNDPSAVNVWFADRGPEWKLEMDLGNQDLALLTGYKLMRNWNTDLRLVARVSDVRQKETAEDFLKLLSQTARIPGVSTAAVVSQPDETPPPADLHIFPLPDAIDFNQLRRYSQRYKAACIFVLDSGQESALV